MTNLRCMLEVKDERAETERKESLSLEYPALICLRVRFVEPLRKYKIVYNWRPSTRPPPLRECYLTFFFYFFFK